MVRLRVFPFSANAGVVWPTEALLLLGFGVIIFISDLDELLLAETIALEPEPVDFDDVLDDALVLLLALLLKSLSLEGIEFFELFAIEAEAIDPESSDLS